MPQDSTSNVACHAGEEDCYSYRLAYPLANGYAANYRDSTTDYRRDFFVRSKRSSHGLILRLRCVIPRKPRP